MQQAPSWSSWCRPGLHHRGQYVIKFELVPCSVEWQRSHWFEALKQSSIKPRQRKRRRERERESERARERESETFHAWLAQVGLAHQQELQAVKDEALAESASLQAVRRIE